MSEQFKLPNSVWVGPGDEALIAPSASKAYRMLCEYEGPDFERESEEIAEDFTKSATEKTWMLWHDEERDAKDTVRELLEAGVLSSQIEVTTEAQGQEFADNGFAKTRRSIRTTCGNWAKLSPRLLGSPNY